MITLLVLCCITGYLVTGSFVTALADKMWLSILQQADDGFETFIVVLAHIIWPIVLFFLAGTSLLKLSQFFRGWMS